METRPTLPEIEPPMIGVHSPGAAACRGMVPVMSIGVGDEATEGFDEMNSGSSVTVDMLLFGSEYGGEHRHLHVTIEP